TTNASVCPGVGPGTNSNPPSSWDGSCTTVNAVAGSAIRSVTVGATSVSEQCSPISAPMTQDLPVTPALARTCSGRAQGSCPNPSDVCMPKLPPPTQDGGASVGGGPWPVVGWGYCVAFPSADPQYTMPCPSVFYTHPYAFGRSVTGIEE